MKSNVTQTCPPFKMDNLFVYCFVCSFSLDDDIFALGLDFWRIFVAITKVNVMHV